MTDVFDPARLDAIGSRQVFDKAREIVARSALPLNTRNLYEPHVIEVARALLAYEPTPDAKTAAREIAVEQYKPRPRCRDCADVGPFCPYLKRPCDPAEWLAERIASAIARATAATRAQTIEECAKVAEAHPEEPAHGAAGLIRHGQLYACKHIASAIRALGGAR